MKKILIGMGIIIILLIVPISSFNNLNSESLSENEIKTIINKKLSEHCENIPSATEQTPTCPDCRLSQTTFEITEKKAFMK